MQNPLQPTNPSRPANTSDANCHQEFDHILESITDAFIALNDHMAVTYFTPRRSAFIRVF